MTTQHASQQPFSDTAATKRCTASAIPSFAPGLLILAAGIVLLLSQMGMIALEDLWRLWPAGLILAGISELEKWWREQQ